MMLLWRPLTATHKPSLGKYFTEFYPHSTVALGKQVIFYLPLLARIAAGCLPRWTLDGCWAEVNRLIFTDYYLISKQGKPEKHSELSKTKRNPSRAELDGRHFNAYESQRNVKLGTPKTLTGKRKSLNSYIDSQNTTTTTTRLSPTPSSCSCACEYVFTVLGIRLAYCLVL